MLCDAAEVARVLAWCNTREVAVTARGGGTGLAGGAGPLAGGMVSSLELVHRGKRPGLRVDFDDDAPFARLVATVADPQAGARAIRSALGRP